jgi:transketolase
VKLSFIPYAQLERIRTLDVDPVERAHAFADACRVNVLYMVARAGSGHIGTSFSCIDVLSWLELEVLTDDDRYFSSKGHDAPALYAVLIGLGRLPFEKLHGLRRLDGLPGHPDVLATPQVTTNTGSLGMGISKARGFVLADRLHGRSGRVFVLTGDGELQEGQFWESLQPTANRRLGDIVVIVDRNLLQSDTWVAAVSDLGDLERKVEAFGWAVRRSDGHDLRAFSQVLSEVLESEPERPKLIVADTVKGCGVRFMEPHELPKEEASLYAFHSGAPAPD